MRLTLSLSLSLSLALALASVFFIAPLAAQAALYLPGATLDPACAPTDPNCGISTIVASSTANSVPYYAANGSVLSATSTFQILSNGTASTTNLIVVNSLTLGTLSGFLKATAGAIATALINLATDVTGILPVANGGTGVAAIASGFIPFGNGTGAVATSSSLYWDSANTRLGVGTAVPAYKLDVSGAGHFSSYLDASYFVATSTTATSTFAGAVNLGTGILLPLRPIDAWGDSFTEENLTYGISYPTILSTLLNRSVYNGGISGQDSSQILARFQTHPEKYGDLAIIWWGQNNLNHGNTANIIPDLNTFVSTLTSNPKQFLVLGLTYEGGDSNHTLADPINTAEQNAYPNNYLDVASMIQSTCNPSGPLNTTGWYASTTADVINCTTGLGFTPNSLLRANDLGHLNPIGYQLVANLIASKLNSMYGLGRALNDVTVTSYFASPPSDIGSSNPVNGKFSNINATNFAMGTTTYGTSPLTIQANTSNNIMDFYENGGTWLGHLTTSTSNLNLTAVNNLTFGVNGIGALFTLASSSNVLSATLSGNDAMFKVKSGNYASQFEQNSNGGYLALTRTSDGGSNSVLRGYGNSTLNVLTGNVGIGTTSPATKLEVGGSTANVTLDGYLNCTVFTTNANGLLDCTRSDERVKQNIVSLDDTSGLAAISGLNPVSFYWRDTSLGTGQQFGLIAQQVQKIFPNLVQMTNPTPLTPDGTLTVNYYGLIAPMIRAIQEIAAQVSSLVTTVAGFADTFTTNHLNSAVDSTQKLCIGSTCVTESQLKTILQSSGQNPITITDVPPLSDSGTGGLGDTPPTTYAITVTQGENGTISPDTQSGIASGTDVPFTITPATGYDVTTLVIDGNDVATSTTYDFTNVIGNHTIGATFVAKPADAPVEAPADPAVPPAE